MMTTDVRFKREARFGERVAGRGIISTFNHKNLKHEQYEYV